MEQFTRKQLEEFVSKNVDVDAKATIFIELGRLFEEIDCLKTKLRTALLQRKKAKERVKRLEYITRIYKGWLGKHMFELAKRLYNKNAKQQHA